MRSRAGGAFTGEASEIAASPSKIFRKLRGSPDTIPLGTEPVKREQSNTSIVYGERFILKMFRRLQEGVNPDLEIGAFLTEKTSFEHVPNLAGSFQFRRGNTQRYPRHPAKLGAKRGRRLALHARSPGPFL